MAGQGSWKRWLLRLLLVYGVPALIIILVAEYVPSYVGTGVIVAVAFCFLSAIVLWVMDFEDQEVNP